MSLKRTLVLFSLMLLLGCSSVTQRHDFLSSPQNSENICGDQGDRQNALVVHLSKSTFVIQAKSIGGLYMSGLFFAPIIPSEPLNSKVNVIRIYSQPEFSPEDKEEFRNWEMKSQDSIKRPDDIKFQEETGSIGNFSYSHIAELSFERSAWATDFTLLVNSSKGVEKFDFISKSKWDYQWMGHEQHDPKCLSR